jgi:hypothetical protein
VSLHSRGTGGRQTEPDSAASLAADLKVQGKWPDTIGDAGSDAHHAGGETMTRLTVALTLLIGLTGGIAPAAIAQQTAATAAPAAAPTFRFQGQTYQHRWSKNGQHEFTPAGQEDLSRWKEMITLNVHDEVHDSEQLAALANAVLGNYQRMGQILFTDSRPMTLDMPAEHMMAAQLQQGDQQETAYARVALVDGTGMVVVYSKRSTRMPPAQEAQAVGQALIGWQDIPAPATLRALPESD